MNTLREKIMDEIFAELHRAETKFPRYPRDPVHAAAIVAEELGELQRAILHWTYERNKGGFDDVRSEALQTAAMGLRFCFNLQNMIPRPAAGAAVWANKPQ